MKKVLASMSGIIFGVFCIAILGLLMSFTLGALRLLFPNSFVNQMWGLVLFDLAAMVWGLAFVFRSESTTQYAAAGIGFVTGFLGTLLMVAFEVMNSGQRFVDDGGSLGKWAVYGFILVTAIHAALVYLHHASSPEIHTKINVGVARGGIVTEAIKQATDDLERNKSDLAQLTRQQIVDDVKRDLSIPIAVDPNVGFVPATPGQLPYPVETQPKKKGMFEWLKKPSKTGMNTNEQTVVAQAELQPISPAKDSGQEDKPAPGPFPGNQKDQHSG